VGKGPAHEPGTGREQNASQCEHGQHAAAELCAFDLIELDGVDHRRVRIEERKRSLAKLLGRFQPGIVVNALGLFPFTRGRSWLCCASAKR